MPLYYVHVQSLGLRLSKLVPKICHPKVIHKATLFPSREFLLSNTYSTYPRRCQCLDCASSSFVVTAAAIFFSFIWYHWLVDQLPSSMAHSDRSHRTLLPIKEGQNPQSMHIGREYRIQLMARITEATRDRFARASVKASRKTTTCVLCMRRRFEHGGDTTILQG